MTDQPSAGEPSQPEKSSVTRTKRGRKPGPPRARLSVRMPLELYERLQELAGTHSATLNQEVIDALEHWAREKQQQDPPHQP